MNTPLKVTLYVILSVAALVFGNYFLRDYQRVNAEQATNDDFGDPMDVDIPDYHAGGSTPPQPEPEEEAATEPAPEGEETATSNLSNEEPVPETPLPTTETTETVAAAEAEADLPPPRLGFYGGGFCLFMLAIGIMAAFDISSYLGRGAVNTLFNDDGVGTMDDDYEIAEAEWQRGDYLEAIRLMREYLAKNPKQVHAALRIAEIYEKDLNNPLAAALEYEEILEKKLPRERWGWAAIHLANLYSGPLEKPDQALALLRRLDEEYGDTQAAEKARRRLAMVDGTAPPSEEA